MSTTTLATSAQAVAQKFAGIRDFQEHKRGLVGRRTEMHVIQVALAAKLHPLLFGTPGVAKSMTVDGILRHFPLSQFKTQAYKASPPEQFLGPVSIKQMAEDKFVRILTGKAAASHVFFCDEISRAPRAVLPAFQGMMVEREFDAGDGAKPVPLISLIGTANHIPEDPELEAFFDRFALKLIVKPPASQQQFVQIMQGALRRRDMGEPTIPDELVIDMDELLVFQRFVEMVHVPDEILEALGELRSNHLGAGIEPSIRRYVDLTKAMQACAALDNGRDVVTIDDMQVAMHSLWSAPDQAEAVRSEVVQFASEWVKTKADLLDRFAETLDRLGQVQALVAAGAEPTARATVREGGDEVERSITDHGLKVSNDWNRKLRPLIEAHIAEASAGQDTSDLQAVLTQIDAGRAWISERLLSGLVL